MALNRQAKEAGVEEIARVEGVNAALAKRIYATLHGLETAPPPGAEPSVDTAAEEPEVLPEHELATPDAPAADTAAAAAAPQTADAIAWAATVALLSGGGAALLKKRR